MHCALKPVDLTRVEIVRQCHSMAGGDFKDLMLAVAVKRRPLDVSWAVVGPVVIDGLAPMFDAQYASWNGDTSVHLYSHLWIDSFFS